MTDKKTSPYAPRIASRNNVSVPEGLGKAAQTCNVAVPRPMPCIVILVHGVNDVGEAYQNQETGIIAGLSKRLNRTDLYAHEWKDFMMMHNEEAQKKIAAPGRSPVIPFYWGYKPVKYDDWVADQQNYRKEVDAQKLGDKAHIPYDAYQQNDKEKMKAVGNDGDNKVKFQNDNWNNALDMNFAKGGGTFANATTSIPDMLGPGAGGAAVAAAGFSTLYLNGGDYTHPIFPNPHRIYQFFAAQRLADLIIQIRDEPVTENDVINVVAHSQGTIITMLANMLVKQAGYSPANCVILNNSPYSLESRLMENAQSGHHQTSAARQQTFKNFCAVMAEQYKGGELSGDDIEALEGSCTLRRPEENPLRKDNKYRRNNNGKVYNYFCPNDGTVSLKNVQGFGWRGIPGELASAIPNLRQRVFCQHVWVGKAPDEKPFEMPPSYKGDFKYSVATNASYTASDVIINGEELPETFMFRLQGQDNHPDNDEKTCDAPYKANIDPDSPDAYISYSAKAYAISRTASATYPLDDYQRRSWFPGHVLTESELQTESNKRNVTVIHGMVSGSKDFPALTLTWLKSRDELEKEWQKSDPVSYSQHSSVVMSEFAPSHAMAFDLAIGQCKAFNYKAGEFWEALLHRADWRDVHNGNVDAKEYYRTGRLPLEGTKNYMNKPDEVIPSLKECGVVNQFMNATKVIPSRDLATGNKEVPNTQWDRPDTLTDRQMKG
ncbi:TPA: T6SS effector phospholipase Tle3 domain-containing protein [Klebsiella michiganensis]